MELEVISYIVIAVFAFWFGWHARGLIFMAAISDNPEKIIKLLEEIKKINKTESASGDTTKVEVLPECVNNYWYAYAKETGQFLGQGPTLEDAVREASLRFPNKTFWCETEKSNLAKGA